jgi:3-oxoacyl-[acyl-carrier-protein] synthase II
MSARDVVITGIGIVSSLGQGVDVHVDAALSASPPNVDETTFAPFPVHPAVAVELDRHIPKKADQRQMEPWQRLGTYAAGAALEDAGLKGDAEALARMHMVVACGGGERDYAVDGQILTGLRDAARPGVFLNERLMSDIRPTLFLAQLSNLLAGNISIVHGVIGGSRTFMGEEQAGVDALRIAEARIRSGQNDLFLVGGATNAERPDLLLVYELGSYLWKRPWRPVAARDGGGFVAGTVAAFMVLEAREHAAARGRSPVARLSPVEARRAPRQPGSVGATVGAMARALGVEALADPVAVSGATGVAGVTDEELAALDTALPNARRVLTGDLVGHSIEAQFPFGVALAAGLAARTGRAGLVTSVGHHRGEGAALVTPAATGGTA